MKSLRDLLTSTSIIGSFHTTDMLDSIIDVNQRIALIGIKYCLTQFI